MKPKIILMITSYCLLITCFGCDAFMRKFTRKPKTENLPVEELVIEPQEYKASQDKEGQYRQYFLFWKSWQSELIVSLQEKRSQKKLLDCLGQAISNLENLGPFLKPEIRDKLGSYIKQEKVLLDFIQRDVYGNNTAMNISMAERLKSDILKNFSYNKIKDYLF